jgi:hypothetical protein
MNRIVLVMAIAALGGACAHKPSIAPTPAPPPPPSPAERYAALPDTAVCVVDRTTQRGLRLLEGKVEGDGKVVVLVSGRIHDLDSLHPVAAASGYAGREAWALAGDPLTVRGRRYEKVGPERLIPYDQLQRFDDYRAVPLFADPKDPAPPRALYLPLRTGCVFQPYVRADLLR